MVARGTDKLLISLALGAASMASASALAAEPATAAFPIVTQTEDGQPIPRSAGLPYAPKNLADRIVLTAGADPAREMAVAFRTDPAQASAEAEIALSVDGPTLGEKAKRVTGQSMPVDSSYGRALYHQVRFEGLTPDTVYNYRVKGAAGWSEWYQFRTAAAADKPFRFLYLGDIQNGILATSASSSTPATSSASATTSTMTTNGASGTRRAAIIMPSSRSCPRRAITNMSTRSSPTAAKAAASDPIGPRSSRCRTMA
jgi:hypothetical protein